MSSTALSQPGARPVSVALVPVGASLLFRCRENRERGGLASHCESVAGVRLFACCAETEGERSWRLSGVHLERVLGGQQFSRTWERTEERPRSQWWSSAPLTASSDRLVLTCSSPGS